MGMKECNTFHSYSIRLNVYWNDGIDLKEEGP